jgi:hypothetical protein
MTVAQLKQMKITPSGYGVHFPAINADLWYPAMLRGQHFSRDCIVAPEANI